MTQKALQFVIDGMLMTEKENLAKRVTYILTGYGKDELVDGLTDGFVIGAEVRDYDLLAEYVKNQNKSKVLGPITSVEMKKDGPFCNTLRVTFDRTYWRKPDGNKWETRNEESEAYTEKVVEPWSADITLRSYDNIPGVDLEVL